MAYATRQDAIDRYGADYVIVSCDRDGDGDLDETTIDLALDDASDWIDSYLVGRFALPFAGTPRQLVKTCIDVAIYMLCEGAPTMTTQKQDRFKTAVEFMEAVKAGERKLTLGGVDVAGRNASTSAQTITQPTQRTERESTSRRFTRDKLGRL